MYRRLLPVASLFVIAVSVLLCLAAPGHVYAVEEGLRITPVREFLSVDAGNDVRSQFTVTNLSDDSLRVTFSVQQFSVADYTYDYVFNRPENDWLRLGLTETTIEPGKSQNVPYSLAVPSDGRPGGHYYTLFATADLANQGLSSTIQATDLLYVTVNGELSRTTRLDSSHIQRLSFGHDISFSLQPANTGNIHLFAYVSSELRGLSAKPAASPQTHILLPGKTRTIGGTIPAPLLPGIYRAVVGYKTDADQTVTTSQLIVFIPPWFIAVLLGVLLLAGRFFPKRRKSKTQARPDDPSTQ